jgi:hypothetical protein
MNVTSAYSHSNIAFRGNRSDQNHHGQTAQAPHLSESPAVTLSRVIQDGRSQLLATTPVSFSPLSAVQLALSNQILLFENVTFQGGKNTFGPPITLSRLEKHQAIQKAKRDKALTVNYS